VLPSASPGELSWTQLQAPSFDYSTKAESRSPSFGMGEGESPNISCPSAGVEKLNNVPNFYSRNLTSRSPSLGKVTQIHNLLASKQIPFRAAKDEVVGMSAIPVVPQGVRLAGHLLCAHHSSTELMHAMSYVWKPARSCHPHWHTA
jgi:hypothetical protein